MQDFVDTGSGAEPNVPVGSSQPAPQADEEELGLLDLMDLAEERFSVVKGIAEQIGAGTAALGASLQVRAQEVNLAVAAAARQLNRREARVLIERAAADMDQYVAGVRAQLPLFRNGADAIAPRSHHER